MTDLTLTPRPATAVPALCDLRVCGSLATHSDQFGSRYCEGCAAPHLAAAQAALVSRETARAEARLAASDMRRANRAWQLGEATDRERREAVTAYFAAAARFMALR